MNCLCRVVASAIAFVMFGLASYSAQAGYLQSEPLHQKACYELDRASGRTSASVRSAKGDVRVERQLDNGAYDVSVRAVFSVALFGEEYAGVTIEVPAEYFTPAFLETLREVETYQARDFKMRHLGRRDVTTLDGENFPNTDFVEIYDLETSRRPDGAVSVHNARLKAAIIEGVPALGGASLDVVTSPYGVRVKAGMDYTADERSCTAY